MKDLYQVLEVSTLANTKIITKAYRKKASLYHPDRNQSPTAKEMFQSIFEAYNILSDETRRKEYDHERNYFLKQKNSTPHPSSLDVNINQQENLFLQEDDDNEDMLEVKISLEQAFNGCIKTLRAKPLVDRNFQKEKVEISIPRGVKNKQILEIKRSNNHEEDSLFVKVSIKRHPLFRLKKEDLILIVPISISSAVLGTSLKIPTLTGAIEFSIPPQTHGGSLFIIENQGFISQSSKRGNLLIQIHIDIPEHITDKERQWLKQFGTDKTPLIKEFDSLIEKVLSKRVA